MGLGVARGLWFSSDGALTGCFQSRTIGSGSASWTCPDQTGASLGLGVAQGLWFFSDGALTGCFQSRTLDLRLQAGRVQSRRVPVWVWDGSRPLVFFRRCPDWLLPILNNWIWVCKLDLSRPDGCQFGFGGGSRPLVFFRRCPDWMLPILNNWIWVCKLDLSRPDGCQFGFEGGSRPLVFFKRCPDWMLPILNNDLVWAWKLVMRIPDLKRAVSGPSTPFGLEMVKFGPNFCYCAVDQKNRF